MKSKIVKYIYDDWGLDLYELHRNIVSGIKSFFNLKFIRYFLYFVCTILTLIFCASFSFIMLLIIMHNPGMVAMIVFVFLVTVAYVYYKEFINGDLDASKEIN